MPTNWKSYESSVRLLSAILAAHPELKLNYQEIADSFGDNATGSSMQFRFRRVKIDADAIKKARAQGRDPMTLDMDGGLCKEISRRYGGDCTVSALDNRFRRIKGDAKLLNDALGQGIDPITVPTDSLNGRVGKERHIITTQQASNSAAEIAMYYEDCTASALDHRFRPIKRDAKAMREGIADKYGENATAKAVSTRFERLKKEPSWLTNSNSGANGNSNGTPRKPTTPAKQKNIGVMPGDGNEDDEEVFGKLKVTPKKEKMNRTQGGRVSKPQTPKTPRKMNDSFTAGMASIQVISDDEEAMNIKMEALANGHDNGFPNMDAGDAADDVAGFYDQPEPYVSGDDVV